MARCTRGCSRVCRLLSQTRLRLHPPWHPRQNPDPAAAQRWLEVQAAHAELTERGAGDPFTRRYREQQRARAEAAAAWRAFWGGARRPPPRIPSSTPSLDASSFSQRVLSAAGRGPGAPPWLIQVFAADSPYCRALSGEWEAAAAEAGGLLHMGRVDFHEQPMLVCGQPGGRVLLGMWMAQHAVVERGPGQHAVVDRGPGQHAFAHLPACLHPPAQVRFLASRLRGLFLGVQPWRELPVAFGLPRGCLSMACAVPFSGHFTAERLQRFAAARLLRLPALPPLTSRLLGSWCHAVPAGRVGVLALLRPGHTPPTALLDAVQKGRGLLHAAAAEWRCVTLREGMGTCCCPLACCCLASFACHASPCPASAAHLSAGLLTERFGRTTLALPPRPLSSSARLAAWSRCQPAS